MGERLPHSGTADHIYEPEYLRTRPPVRSEETCSRCGRLVEHWRRIGLPSADTIRCNGEDRTECGARVHAVRQAADIAGTRARARAQRLERRAAAILKIAQERARQLQRLDEVEAEKNAAVAAGIAVWMMVVPDRLALSATLVTECRVCGRPFMAFVEAKSSYPRRCEAHRAAASRQDAVDKEGADTVADRLAQAEEQRRRSCPRPDKVTWHSLEAAEQIVQLMRDTKGPRAANLHGYLCLCGAYHVGNRTKFGGRWGPTYATSLLGETE